MKEPLYPHRRELLADLGHDGLVDADEEGVVRVRAEAPQLRRGPPVDVVYR